LTVKQLLSDGATKPWARRSQRRSTRRRAADRSRRRRAPSPRGSRTRILPAGKQTRSASPGACPLYKGRVLYIRGGRASTKGVLASWIRDRRDCGSGDSRPVGCHGHGRRRQPRQERQGKRQGVQRVAPEKHQGRRRGDRGPAPQGSQERGCGDREAGRGRREARAKEVQARKPPEPHGLGRHRGECEDA